MPKALSLKKAPSQVSKNQKAITQFFKAPTKDDAKKCLDVKATETSTVIKVEKRKATSPIKRNGLKTSPVKENFEVKSKKCKLEHNGNHKVLFQVTADSKSDSPEKLKCISPEKPNGCASKNRSPLSCVNNGNQIKASQGNSPSKEKSCSKSPTNVLRTPEKTNGHHCNLYKISPSKSLLSPNLKQKSKAIKTKGQSPLKTAKVLEFESNGNVDDLFDEEWGMEEIDADCREDLDLSTMQRCEVLSVNHLPMRLEVRLKNDCDKRCTCYIEGVWMNTSLQPQEIVSILASKNTKGEFCIDNNYGLLSLRPDHLISTTTVVAGVFCKRKAILQERWKGIDSANTAMTIGILIHELVQKALTQKISNVTDLRRICDELVNESIHMLYDAGINKTEARSNMEMYITPLAEFMQLYTTKNHIQANKKNKWNGQIDEVLDIEENVCCPKLGLKGKIDATLQVTIHERAGKKREIIPLELKSGRASGSAEHRGQLVLYGMMLSLQRKEDPITTLQRGLLLYLKDQVDVRDVSCGYPERRDLIMLRNELVMHLASGPNEIKTNDLVDIEEASQLLQQTLPEPVYHEGACSKCPYLTLCSLHLWHTNDVQVSENHPLRKLRSLALDHVTSSHVTYFLHWTSLIKMEEKSQASSAPLHALWTDSAENRAKRGTCAANLTLKSVQSSGDRYSHVFERSEKAISGKTNNGPKEGEFSIVSLDDRPWIAAGVVSVANADQIHILLERNLSSRHSTSTKFHIDAYESYASTVQNLTNLGVLMEDSDRALRLRKLIIDKDEPVFTSKLARDVGRLGAKLMRGLNIEQQRAVLRAIAANDYALLQGLPGTGKTQTISVLIQMLVALKQRVLVTAHTHSAVDTVLTRLPNSLRVMRLGSSARVSSNLLERSEASLTKQCTTAEELSAVYDSMEVVGVTCLGANHGLLSKTTFDVCIVDEATQVLQCTVLRPLFAAKRFVLVGDPEQLPPVVRSKAARRLGMEESLFHRLMSEDCTSTLRLQYRMNQALVDVANTVAYRQRLKCANESVAESTMSINTEKIKTQNYAQWIEKACSNDKEDAAVFINVEAISKREPRKTLTNIDEACVVFAAIEVLVECGIKTSDIGVIAPYRDQVSLLRQSLSHLHIDVSTVDQFQGRDKSVIIYSCTKQDGQDDKVKDGEVLNDQRRLAVSVTRAKHKFIAIGNERVLRRYQPLSKLIDACKRVNLTQNVILELVNKYKDKI